MPSRLAILREQLDAQQLDAFLVSQPENRRYLSGFTGDWGYLLVSSQLAILATDSRYVTAAAQQAPLFAVEQVIGEDEKAFEVLLRALPHREEELGAHSESLLLGNTGEPLSRVGFEAEDLSYAAYERLRTVAERNRIALVPVHGPVEEQRMVKEADELREIEQAVALTDEAYAHLLTVLRPGMTEREAAWEFEKYVREHGGEGLAFPTIVGSGANAALPHAEPSDKAIAAGETVVIDMGARVHGYNADLTRTICFGSPPEELQRIYAIVLAAQEAALANIQAGMTGAAADAVARRIIEDAGFGEAFGHSLGHGIGLAVHEMPRLRRASPQILRDGMVFSIEPGIYLPGLGGVRIEDTVLLKGGHAQSLSKAKKSRQLGGK